MKQYELTESTVHLEGSTDEARMITIVHSEGQITLSFAFGKLISGDVIQNETKTKIK